MNTITLTSIVALFVCVVCLATASILHSVAVTKLQARIAILEQKASSRTATIEWHQNGDTLWVGRHIIIGEMP